MDLRLSWDETASLGRSCSLDAREPQQTPIYNTRQLQALRKPEAFKQVELHSRHRVKPSCLDAPIPEASRAPLMLDRKLDPHSLTDPG